MHIVPISLLEGEEPFPSIEAMRVEHLLLLEQQVEWESESGLEYHGEVASRGIDDSAKLDSFLRRGVALGRFLDSSALRSEAQNMLDYWVSTLAVQQRGMSKEISRILPSVILERFDISFLSGIITQTSQLFQSLTSDEREVARKILMRLAPMAPQGETFNLTAVETNSLTGGESMRQVLLDKLETAGIVIRTAGTGGKSDHWRLAHESVSYRWPDFAEWTAERRRFRQAATLWDEAKRSPDRLSTREETLGEALGYRDLTSVERDFLEASSAATKRLKSRRQTLRTVATSVLGTFVALYLFSINRNKTLVIEVKKSEFELAQANTVSPEIVELREERDVLREKLDILIGEIAALQKRSEPSSLVTPVRDELVTEGYIKAGEWLIPLPPQSGNPDDRPEKFGDLEWMKLGPLKGGPLFASTDDRAIKYYLASLDQRGDDALSPGTIIGGEDETQTYGSSGIFLTNQTGQIFLAAPSYVIGTERGAPVVVRGRPIGNIEKSFGTPGDPRSISIARLSDGITAENILPSVGAITGWISNPSPGTDVILIGYGSGIRSGKILRIEKDGTIVTTRISQPGDGGVPVITNDGNLLGFLLYSRGGECFVSPCGPLLELTGLEILVTQSDPSIIGALAQIIVPSSDPTYLEIGNEVLKTLEKDGFFIPDGEVLLRASAPSQIDIRYYREEDHGIASKTEKKLRDLGFDRIKIWRIDDSDPPHKFIQIAFSADQLDKKRLATTTHEN
jgi:hypothetical protein